ncbi:hypothetical protein Aperf_G00000052546 [Anoplocephala perfoliata]
MNVFLISFFALTASASAFQTDSYHIFMDCYDPICNLRGTYGFNCKNGICSYVCTASGCHLDGLRNRNGLGTFNTIFYGCHSAVCNMDGFYGYGCHDGVCQYICSERGCHEGIRISPQRRRRRNRKEVEEGAEVQKEIADRENQEYAGLKTTTKEPVSSMATAPVLPSTTERVQVTTVYSEPTATNTTTTATASSTTTTTTTTSTTTVEPITTVKMSAETGKESDSLNILPKPMLPEKKKKPKKPKLSKRKEKTEGAKKTRRLKQQRM